LGLRSGIRRNADSASFVSDAFLTHRVAETCPTLGLRCAPGATTCTAVGCTGALGSGRAEAVRLASVLRTGLEDRRRSRGGPAVAAKLPTPGTRWGRGGPSKAPGRDCRFTRESTHPWGTPARLRSCFWREAGRGLWSR
jgi:hypothetical protein